MIMKDIIQFINAFVNNKPMATVLLIAIIVDIIFGVLRAMKQKVLNSTIGNGGLIKKCAIILCVIFLMFVDFILHIDVINWLPQDVAKFLGLEYIGLATFFSIFFIIFELLSIIKNMEMLGIPMPKFIRNLLEQTIENLNKDEPNS